MPDIYLGDVGVEFRIDTESTVTSATTAMIYIRRPDGSEATWPASTYTETVLTFTVGTSTESAYIATTDPAGEWKGQAFVVLGAASSKQFHGAPFVISVGDPIS